MDYQKLFEKYTVVDNELKQEEVQTPTSASIDILEPTDKMLGKSGISEKEFDKMFEEILNKKI